MPDWGRFGGSADLRLLWTPSQDPIVSVFDGYRTVVYDRRSRRVDLGLYSLRSMLGLLL